MRIRIGARFMERITAELKQSASHASRKNFEQARACYETATQMIDTFLQETGLQEYLDDATQVAPESKPPAPAKSPAKKTRRTKKPAAPAAKKDSGAGEVPGS